MKKKSEINILRLNQKTNKPDFFGLIPPRSASTWLFKNLSTHPDIFFPQEKELKYFSNYLNMCDIDWYLGCFDGSGDKKRGEISPSYTILPDKIIEMIHSIFPELKIVVLLRDPIERAWSHVKHQYRLKESVFVNYYGVFDSISYGKMVEALTNSWMLAYSDYLNIIKRWMTFYPKENFYINFFDSVIKEPEVILQEICDHIGVTKEIRWTNLPYQRVNEGIKKSIPNDIRKFLQSLFWKRMQEFSQFVLAEFNMKLPTSWNYILNTGDDDKIIIPSNVYFEHEDNQALLEDVLLRETMQCTHVELLRKNYRGFKIIAFKNECLALSVSHGMDIVSSSKSDIERLKREFKIICGETLNDVLNLVNEFCALDDKLCFKTVLLDKDDIIKKQSKELKLKESRIYELQDNISDRDIKMKEFRDELSGRDGVIKEQEEKLAHKESRIQEFKAGILERDLSLKDKDKNLLNKKDVIKKQSEELKLKESRIYELQDNISDRDIKMKEFRDELSGRDGVIKEQEEKLAHKESRIQEFKAGILERDLSLKDKDKNLLNKKDVIKKQSEELKLKESRIYELQDNISDRDINLKKLQNKISSQDGIITKQNEKLEGLQTELAQIKSSRGFRFYKFIKGRNN